MRNFLLENMGIKISAVALALILWFFVTSKGQSEISMDVPLELKNVPQGLESVKQGVKSVSVNIKGQERLLKNLKPFSVRINVDLSKAKKGRGMYYINKDDVNLPPALSVISINPMSVWITLEETVIKTVPVRPVIAGSPKNGFYVDSTEFTPRAVTIEGARTEVSRISSLNTEPVDIADADKPVVQDVRIDTSGMNIRTDIQEIGVKVVITGGKRK